MTEQVNGLMVGKDHRLTSDAHNIILSERLTSKKTGEDYWRNTNYFSSIKNALHFLVEHKIRGTGFKNIGELTDKIDELHTMIDNIKIPAQIIKQQPATIPPPETPQLVLKRFRRTSIKTHAGK